MQKPVRRGALAEYEIDGERVVWDVDSGRVAHLDATANAIWQVIDGEATVDDLVDDVAAAFGADRDRVADDVRRLLDSLAADGFVSDREGEHT